MMKREEGKVAGVEKEREREGGTGLHIQIKINDIETIGLEQTASDRPIIGHWTPATPQFRLS